MILKDAIGQEYTIGDIICVAVSGYQGNAMMRVGWVEKISPRQSVTVVHFTGGEYSWNRGVSIIRGDMSHKIIKSNALDLSNIEIDRERLEHARQQGWRIPNVGTNEV